MCHSPRHRRWWWFGTFLVFWDPAPGFPCSLSKGIAIIHRRSATATPLLPGKTLKPLDPSVSLSGWPVPALPHNRPKTVQAQLISLTKAG